MGRLIYIGLFILTGFTSLAARVPGAGLPVPATWLPAQPAARLVSGLPWLPSPTPAAPALRVTPTISASGTMNPLSAIYGAVSQQNTFTVSGTSLTEGILVTAPAGFEISLNSSGAFVSSLLLGNGGTVAPTNVYIQTASHLNASATAYTGVIILSSAGAGSVNSPSLSGTINQVPMTLYLSQIVKTYGSSFSSVSSAQGYIPTGAYGDVITGVSVTADAASSSTLTPVGDTYSLQMSDATGSPTFLLSNYSINYRKFTAAVVPQPLTITAANDSHTYGTPFPAGAGSTAFTSSGLQNGETIGSVTLNFSSGNNTTDGVNSYANSASVTGATGGTFNPSNYSIVYLTGNLDVTPAPLTVTGNTAKVYGTGLIGGANSYSFTPVGLMNNETINTVTIAYGTGAAGTDPVGIYYSTATPTQATGGSFDPANYDITYEAGVIYVAPKPLIIHTTDYTKNYGTPLVNGPGFTEFSSLPLPNSEVIDAVTMTFGSGGGATDIVGTYSKTELASAPVGTTFLASNYLISYLPANIIVVKEPVNVSVSIAQATKPYGTAFFSGSGQTGFTATGLRNGDVIGSVTLAYGTGAAATDAATTYSGSIQTSLAAGGTFAPSNYTFSYTPADLIVSPASLTITATDAVKIYGNALTGGPGSAAFTSPALPNGETLTSVNIGYGAGSSASSPAGNYPGSVTASSPLGGSGFLASNYSFSYIPGDLSVSQAPLTITAGNASHIYGSPLTPAAGSTNFTSSGLVNSETIGSVTPAYSSGNGTSDPVGTYTGAVQVSSPTGGTFDPANYSIVYATADLAVTAAPVTVTAKDVSKIYGTALAGVSGSTAFTSPALPNGETLSSVSIGYLTGATSGSPAGNYPGSVTASLPVGGNGFLASNYNFIYTAGVLSVGAAPLTITAGNASHIYGSPLTPAAGSTNFTSSGLVNLETIGSVTPAYSSGNGLKDPVGTYPSAISISGATGGTFDANNYSIVYATADLAVTQAPLTITATGIYKTYGNQISGAPGSAAFTATTMPNGEAISSVTIAYGTGSSANSPAGNYPGSVTASSPIGGGGYLSSNYSLTYIQGNISVGQTLLTITAGNASHVYGSSLTPAAGSTNFTSAGLLGTETIGSVTPAYSSGNGTSDPVGAYTSAISISGATGGTFTPGNYSIVYAGADLAVTQAPLTITATGVSKVYGNALAGVSGSAAFTHTALPNGETLTSVSIGYGAGSSASSAVANYPGSVTASSPAGGSSFLASNYSFSYIPGDLSVGRANLTITAGNDSHPYGSPLSTLPGSTNFTSSGLLSPETIGSVTPAYSSGNGPNDPVGAYPGAVQIASATGGTFTPGNYSIVYAGADLAVTQAPLTITGGQSKVYGTILTGGASSSNYTQVGLLNSETIGSVSLAYGAGSLATDAVNTYPGSVQPSAALGGTFTPGNYLIQYNAGDLVVNPFPLVITALPYTKTFGTTLVNGPGYTGFLTSALMPNSESIGTVSLDFGTGISSPGPGSLNIAGADATAPVVGTYPGQVTPFAAVGVGVIPSNYTFTYLPANIQILPHALSILPDAALKTYGDVLTGAIVQTGFTPTGLQNSDVIGSVSLSYGLGSAASDAVTNYPLSVTVTGAIAAAGGSFDVNNYIITYGQADLAVMPAPLIITANGASKTYGDPLNGLSGSVAFTPVGLKNSENIGSVTLAYGAGSLATDAVKTYPGSVQPSTPVGGSFNSNNYIIQYTGGDLVVNPFPVSVLALPYTKIFGTILVSGPGYTGFSTSAILPNSETIGSVNFNFSTSVGAAPGPGALTIAGADASAPVLGTYTNQVMPSDATGTGFLSSNYALVYIPGDIHILPYALILTATGPLKTYGSGLSILTGATGFLATATANNELVNTVTLSPDAAGADPYTPAGSPYLIHASDAAGSAGFLLSNYALTYTDYQGTVDQAPLTITSTGPVMTYGDPLTSTGSSAAFTAGPMASGESISSVSYGINTSVNIGGQLPGSVAGATYSVTPSAAIGAGGNDLSNYKITYVPFIGSINRAPLTISALAATKVYGATLPVGASPSSFISTGLKNHETIGTVSLNYGPGNAKTAPVNTYTDAVSLTAASGGSFSPINYMITYLPAALSVTPAPLLITAAPVQKVYGNSLGDQVSGNFTATGLQNNENIGTVTSAFGAGGPATSPVGIYALSGTVSSASGGSFLAANYSISYLPSTVTVTPAPLSVLASDLTKIYGTSVKDSAASLNYTISGLKNGESSGAASLTFGVGAASAVGVGTYTGSVQPSLLSGGSFSPLNYSITYYAGNITIRPALLSISPADVPKLFGTVLTDMSGSSGYTSSGFQNSETSATVSLTYTNGAAAASLPGTYAGSVQASGLSGGTFNPLNYTISYLSAKLIVGTNTPAIKIITQPDCSTSSGLISIGNYNGSYTYQLSPSVSVIQSGSTFMAPPGTYTLTALAPASFTSPVSSALTINVQPPIPQLIVTSPAEVGAPATVDITAAAVTALTAPGLVYSYFIDRSGSYPLANPNAVQSTGVYYIRATNAYGCSSSLKPVFVNINPLPVMIVVNPAAVNDPSGVDITSPSVTAGSSPGLTFTYYSDSAATIPVSDPGLIRNAGVYYIKGTDAFGMYVIKKVLVTIEYQIYIPNVFTPNGDGKNDRFEVVGIVHFPGSSLLIFNRWGNQIYQSSNYQNTWNGSDQVPGTYYYALTLNKKGTTKVYKGWVQILH